jgi:hypothetical protein
MGYLIKATILMIVTALALAGCERGEPRLLNLKKSQSGPDEFAILPNKPLQEPASFAELPAPTLGQSNLADPTPFRDAVATLGGGPQYLKSDGRADDNAVLTHAGRYGTDAKIRSALAASDLAFREANRGRLLERAANVNIYFKAYAKQALDQHAELTRLRTAGVRTPAAPPLPLDE